jgi:hypothetical protein
MWIPKFIGNSEIAVGDYFIVGVANHIVIERRDLDDSIGWLTIGRQRIEKERHRGRVLDYFALSIEANPSDLFNGRHHSKMLPKLAIRNLPPFVGNRSRTSG